MLEKERGWVLSIDEASNLAGVSLWYNGQLRATTVLKSRRSTDALGARLIHQVSQLEPFLRQHVYEGDHVSTLLFEGVRARLVLVTVGAFLTCPLLAHLKVHPKHSFVESTTWKNWAKKRGATGLMKDIKGVRALLEIGFPTAPLGYELTEDEADSILIYLAWRDRK